MKKTAKWTALAALALAFAFPAQAQYKAEARVVPQDAPSQSAASNVTALQPRLDYQTAQPVIPLGTCPQEAETGEIYYTKTERISDSTAPDGKRYVTYRIYVKGDTEGKQITVAMPQSKLPSTLSSYDKPGGNIAVEMVGTGGLQTLTMEVKNNPKPEEWVDLGAFTYVISGNIAGGYTSSQTPMIVNAATLPALQFSTGETEAGTKQPKPSTTVHLPGRFSESAAVRNSELGTSISNNVEIDIKIYPNPAVEEIHIGMPQGVVISDVIIANLTGQTVFSERGPKSDGAAVSVQSLAPGMYILRATDTLGGTHTVKFQKR